MNKYGTMAKTHWQSAFPQEYNQIEDPESFFTTLGQEVAHEISTLEAELSSQASSPNFLENLGRNRTARSHAEEIVLAQRVWRSEDLDQMDQTGQGSAPATWTPLIEDPSDPWWASQERSEP